MVDPLDESRVVGALNERVHAVERVRAAAAGGLIVRLGPLVNHRERKAEAGGDLLGTGLLEDFAQKFV